MNSEVSVFSNREMPGEKDLAKLANDIYQFIDMLRPFSVDGVTLDPNNVEDVWIDRDSIRKIKGGIVFWGEPLANKPSSAQAQLGDEK
ncbi:hypothetical protein [Burkholderia sp. NLJ2]|uniref:hypothetical protein n=1 Tax=Burkholderia sp. NLJ2 TaxID=3090699 RepID=UPI003C6C0180